MKAMMLFFLFVSSAFGREVPEYRVRVGLEPASKIPRWLIELTPPPGHHFNLAAPMKVEAGSLPFKLVIKKKNLLGFAASSSVLTEKDEGTTSAFLCDDQKTYCVKKTVGLRMRVDPALQRFLEDPAEKSSSGNPADHAKKDRNGFILEDSAFAIRESIRTGKPILIDFFGVWCPPCNLYEEQVFARPGFRKDSKNFVLLKMDSDRESSFQLKSKFGIGGYPTLLVADLVKKDQSFRGEPDSIELFELGRVVGFLPEDQLSKKLSEILRFQRESLDSRIERQKGELAASYRMKIERVLEARDGKEVTQIARIANSLFPESPEWNLFHLKGRELIQDEFRWGIEEQNWVLAALQDSAKQESRILFLALGMVPSFGKNLSESQKRIPFGALEELRRRVDGKIMMVSGTEWSVADLDALEMDLAESFSDLVRVASARKKAIESFQGLMKIQGNPDSRGMNLELAALLAQDGQWKSALAIYERFIKKFPKEFTFHLGAARVFLEIHDLKAARNHAEEAVRYAYGDNLIRSMDRLLGVMQKQGEIAFALKRGEDFLQGLHLDSSLNVRTGRYVSALTKTLDEIRKETTKP